uniref:Putative secreted peptide n=1 Tax=Anopheles braziliensis TaxID=58242 RepID=A0A2M3ZP75_9DIPT
MLIGLALGRLAVLLVASVVTIAIKVTHKVLRHTLPVRLAGEHVRWTGRLSSRASLLIATIRTIVITVAPIRQRDAHLVFTIEKLRTTRRRRVVPFAAFIILHDRSVRTFAACTTFQHLTIRAETAGGILRSGNAHIRAPIASRTGVRANLYRVTIDFHVHRVDHTFRHQSQHNATVLAGREDGVFLPIVPVHHILQHGHRERMLHVLVLLQHLVQVLAIQIAAGDVVLARIDPVQPLGHIIDGHTVRPSDVRFGEQLAHIRTVHVGA